MAAALECEANGNLPIGPDDVMRKIDTVEKQIRFES
jgi:hypothetical protein